MQIRDIQARDDAPLKAIIQNNLKHFALDIPGTAYFDPELAHLSRFYAAAKNRAYFVLTDEQDNALGGCGIAEFDSTHHIAELQKLYLSDQVKGQHYSYYLLHQALVFAKHAGYLSVYLETHHRLKAAVHIYEKLAFKKLPAALSGSLHNSMDLFYMKDLTTFA